MPIGGISHTRLSHFSPRIRFLFLMITSYSRLSVTDKAISIFQNCTYPTPNSVTTQQLMTESFHLIYAQNQRFRKKPLRNKSFMIEQLVSQISMNKDAVVLIPSIILDHDSRFIIQPQLFPRDCSWQISFASMGIPYEPSTSSQNRS